MAVELKPEIKKVTLKIDGNDVTVPDGTMIIEAAKQVGIDIPIFCYHDHMDPFGACRMCIVEIEGAPRVVTACNTPVREGISVLTSSERVKSARAGVLEFTLINHPLDCPICDKGGECPLQDNTMAWGPGKTRFKYDDKRTFRKATRLSQFVVLDMERCIHCKRCIRFFYEIADEPIMDFTARGYMTEIRTYDDKPLNSQFAGNTIEICPVGALTSEIYRFKARPWDIKHKPTICSHCSVGCNMTASVRGEKTMRHLARQNEAINEVWICDKGRFVHHFIDSDERVKCAVMRSGDAHRGASFREAIEFTAARLTALKEKYGAQAIGVIGGEKLANEDVYLLQKFGREVLGTRNIDCRLSTEPGDVQNPVVESFGTWSSTCRLSDLDESRYILVIGADPTEEQPVVMLRLRKAATKRKAHLVVAHPLRIHLAGSAHEYLRLNLGSESHFLNAICAVIATQNLFAESASRIKGFEAVREQLSLYDIAKAARICGIEENLIRKCGESFGKQPSVLVFGNELLARRRSKAALAAACNLILLTGQHKTPGGGLLGLTEHCNSTGAAMLGALPQYGPLLSAVSEPGLSTREMLEAAADGKLKALLIAGADLLLNYPDRDLVDRALKRLDLLVVLELLMTQTAKRADVVFGALSFAERDGTFTNLEGIWQTFDRTQAPYPDCAADWEIISALSNAMGAASQYYTLGDVRREISNLVESSQNGHGEWQHSFQKINDDSIARPSAEFPLMLYTSKVLFDAGNLVSLTQKAREYAGSCFVEMDPKDALQLGVSEGERVRVISSVGEVVVECRIRGHLQPGVCFVPSGFQDAPLGMILTAGVDHACVRIEKK